MAEKEKNTLSKEERIYSLSLIDDLFKGGKSRSMTVFPLRAIYKSWDDDATDAGFQAATLCPKMLISVPKKHFHHAVDRNRVKRQVREAFRKNKQLLKGRNVAIAFIWLANAHADSSLIEKNVVTILQRISEKI
ncbi:ribonuclease P protein component [Prevotella sp.]|uniref:ribonuclease P protein component n=1 Tax=Prevotella sp. TaxID=59823 RepID=UPI002F95C758